MTPTAPDDILATVKAKLEAFSYNYGELEACATYLLARVEQAEAEVERLREHPVTWRCARCGRLTTGIEAGLRRLNEGRCADCNGTLASTTLAIELTENAHLREAFVAMEKAYNESAQRVVTLEGAINESISRGRSLMAALERREP